MLKKCREVQELHGIHTWPGLQSLPLDDHIGACACLRFLSSLLHGVANLYAVEIWQCSHVSWEATGVVTSLSFVVVGFPNRV